MLPSLAIDVVAGYSHTLLRFAPYLIGMGVVFAALSAVSPCNAGKPWWNKRGLVTDLLAEELARDAHAALYACGPVAMLESVVTKEGTAPKAHMDDYRVAGKTGTAQKPDPVARGYSDKRIASFVGMVPAEDPRVVILEYAVHGKIVATAVRYDNRFISVITIEHKKIAHWRDYMDSLAAWTALKSSPRR